MKEYVPVLFMLHVLAGCGTTPATRLSVRCTGEEGDSRYNSFHVVYAINEGVPLAAIVLRYAPGDQDEPAFTVDDVMYSEDIRTFRIDGVSIIPAETFLAFLFGRAREVYKWAFVVYVNGAYGEPVRITVPPAAVDKFFGLGETMIGEPGRDAYGEPTAELMRRFWDTYVVPVTRQASTEGVRTTPGALRSETLGSDGIYRTRPPRTPMSPK